MKCIFSLNTSTGVMRVEISPPIVERLWQEVGELGGFNPSVWIRVKPAKIVGGSQVETQTMESEQAELLKEQFAFQAKVAKQVLESAQNDAGLVEAHFTGAGFRAFTLWLAQLVVAREDVEDAQLGEGPGLFGDDDLEELLKEGTEPEEGAETGVTVEEVSADELAELYPNMVSFGFLKALTNTMKPHP